MPIEEHLGGIAALFTCTPGTPGQLSEHFTRIRTPFQTPDGDLIDLFCRQEAGGLFLSDLGTTLQWLKDQWVGVALPASVRSLLPEICGALGVELRSGWLRISVTQEAETAGALLRLAQAAVRIADLRFALYLQLPPPQAGTGEADKRNGSEQSE